MLRSYVNTVAHGANLNDPFGGGGDESDGDYEEGLGETQILISQPKRVRNSKLPMGFRMAANPWVIRKGQIQRGFMMRRPVAN